MSTVIALAALDEPCPSLQLPDGSETPIRQIDGVGMQLLQIAQNGDASVFWDVAVRCLPGLTDATVREFTLGQVRRVVEIACGAAERVLKEIERPTAPAQTGTPALSSPTPSDS